MTPPRKSTTADAKRRAVDERVRALSPTERIALALELGLRDAALKPERQR